MAENGVSNPQRVRPVRSCMTQCFNNNYKRKVKKKKKQTKTKEKGKNKREKKNTGKMQQDTFVASPSRSNIKGLNFYHALFRQKPRLIKGIFKSSEERSEGKS
jgi:hypothetical protein